MYVYNQKRKKEKKNVSSIGAQSVPQEIFCNATVLILPNLKLTTQETPVTPAPPSLPWAAPYEIFFPLGISACHQLTINLSNKRLRFRYLSNIINSGLFKPLRNPIGPCSDNWQLLWVDSTHTATTAPFLRKPASNAKGCENGHIFSTVEDNPYLFELRIQLIIFIEEKPNF